MPEVIDFPFEIRVGYSPFIFTQSFFEALGLIMLDMGDLVREFAERSRNENIFFVHSAMPVYVPGKMRTVDQRHVSGLNDTFHMLVCGKVGWQRFGIILHYGALRHSDVIVGRIYYPIQTHSGIILIVIQEMQNIPVLLQNDKLIEIYKSDPPGMVMHIVQTVHVRFYLRRIGDIAIDDFHDSFSDIGLQSLLRRITVY